MEKRIKIIEELVDNFMSDFIDSIEIGSEGYPHDSYVSSSSFSNDDFYILIEDVNKILGNEISIIKLFEPKTIEEIQSEMTIENYNNFEELEEVESFTDTDIEPKYNYVTYIFKHVPTGRHISVTIQVSGGVDLDLVFGGIVEKKEIVRTEWV